MKKIIFISLIFASISWSAQRITVMSWNVQNLYDTEHDDSKDDYEFLPKAHPLKEKGCRETSREAYLESCLKTDWTREKLAVKYGQIKKYFSTLSKKPEIVALTEVENIQVVQELARILGYTGAAISHWSDRRGLSTAVIFNQTQGLRYKSTKSFHVLQGPRRRPVFQVAFEFNQKPLHIYVNHWTAGVEMQQPHPIALALRTHIEAEASMLRTPPFSVALGDFNVRDPDYNIAMIPLVDPSWYLRLIDLHPLSRQYSIPTPPGTYYFYPNNTWSMFDRILVSRHFFADLGLKIPINRFRIDSSVSRSVRQQDGTIVEGVPFRYNHNESNPDKAGLSDHFPVFFEIVAP
jgi:hypothetical protein